MVFRVVVRAGVIPSHSFHLVGLSFAIWVCRAACSRQDRFCARPSACVTSSPCDTAGRMPPRALWADEEMGVEGARHALRRLQDVFSLWSSGSNTSCGVFPHGRASPRS